MIRICLYCGNEFNEKRPSRLKTGRSKYCSRKCSALGSRGRISSRKGLHIQTNTGKTHFKKGQKAFNDSETTSICRTCKKEYKIKPSHLKMGRGKHCSLKCRDKKIIKNCLFCQKEFKTKISPSRVNSNRGLYCSRGCRNAAQQHRKQPTSIEKALYDYLLLKGILFERQKLVNGNYTVDAYISSLNLIIEADGEYWHSLPKAKKNDKYKDIYLRSHGYKIIRLREEEINNGSFKERLVFD